MLVNTYGSGGVPPPVNPPVAQDCDCQAVMVPSFFAPIFTLAKPEGRFPAILSSVARSRNSLTGLPPLSFESCAHSTPQRSEANLLPKPPPMWSWWTWICVAGNCSDLARSGAYGVTACVDGHTLIL